MHSSASGPLPTRDCGSLFLRHASLPAPLPTVGTAAVVPAPAHNTLAIAASTFAPAFSGGVDGSAGGTPEQVKPVAVVDSHAAPQCPHAEKRFALATPLLAPATHNCRPASPLSLPAVVGDDTVIAGDDGDGRHDDPSPPTGTDESAAAPAPAGVFTDFVFKVVKADNSQRHRFHKRTSVGKTGTPQYKCHYCDYVSDR